MQTFRTSLWSLLLFAALPTAVCAQEPSVTGGEASIEHTVQTVVVVSAEGTTEFSLTLTGSLQAHLAGSRAKVSLFDTLKIPADRTEQASLAERIGEERSALAVTWLDPTTSTFFVLVRGEDQSQIVERPTTTEPTMLPTTCDGLAAMVRSALSPFLEPLEESQPPPPAQPRRTGEDDEKPFEGPAPAGVEGAGDAPGDDDRRFLLFFELGYGLAIVSADKDLQHGSTIGAGVGFMKHLEVWMRFAALFPIRPTIDTGDDDLRLIRLPLSFGAGAFLPYKDLTLGFRLGMVLDFTTLKGLNQQEGRAAPTDETDHVNPGFTIAPHIRYRVWGPLAIWLSATVSIYKNAYDYEMNDEIIFSLGSLKAAFAAGLAFVPEF